ncbi:BREX-4 system phosphatase PglZ [Pelotomaculum propionicicum]|uniref:DUF7863 domain-containing protein n=1 Tax=Pelotomaculum propionicicum TaxID=258475 RepID=A0A4Y7RXQ1_9FIRM|nr:BREX-4 system phosphatase PglZ [Pelotomaculum propionicicum]TEB13788.1 hypothetical protein Pmgp_00196 [Pelotomaculum propionicicum]
MFFSEVNSLIDYLREEKNEKHRFATRFITVQEQKVWKELISKLYYEVDQSIRLSAICSGEDLFPDNESILGALKSIAGSGKLIMICPIAECARLYPENGEIIRYLAEWPAGNVARVYVPLLMAGDILNNQLNRVTRYKAGILPEVWTVHGEDRVEVIVAPFRGAGTWDSRVRTGIKSYLELWEHGGSQKVWLETKWAPCLPAQQIRSDFRVRLYSSGFDFVRENCFWEGLRLEWGNSSQWEWLATNIQSGESFDKLASRLVGFKEYNSGRLFALWRTLPEDMRWLVWLWSKKKAEPGTYLHHVMQSSSGVNLLARDIALGIFSAGKSVMLIQERKELLHFLGINHMPAGFWDKFNSLTDDLDKLAVLTDISEEERRSIVQSIKNILQLKVEGMLWREKLECVYPVLAWYLMSVDFQDDFLNEYFHLYIRCRLTDQLNDELAAKAREGAEKQLIWNYPSREEILTRIDADSKKVLWVDGLGLEWAGLITQLLMEAGNLEIDVKVARSNLPTTTEANRCWGENDEVERGLDNIAHHYDYRFPNALIEAFEVIKKIVTKIITLTQRYECVVLTADHGLSRFADKAGKVEAPEGTEIQQYGRYGNVGSLQYQPQPDSGWILDGSKAIMLVHEKFDGSGTSAGEVHGGGTLEECLVPVITVRKPDRTVTTAFELITGIVRINPRGKGELIIKCNRAISNVKLKVAGQWLSGEMLTAGKWRFILMDFKNGKYTGKIYCNYRLAQEFEFSVMKGYIEDDLGI